MIVGALQKVNSKSFVQFRGCPAQKRATSPGKTDIIRRRFPEGWPNRVTVIESIAKFFLLTNGLRLIYKTYVSSRKRIWMIQ
jgi:hypothetical protein